LQLFLSYENHIFQLFNPLENNHVQWSVNEIKIHSIHRRHGCGKLIRASRF